HRVAARADTQMDVRFRDVQILEKDVRHRLVVMLTRVHQTGFEEIRALPKLAQQRSDFHEVRTGAGDEEKTERTARRSGGTGGGPWTGSRPGTGCGALLHPRPRTTRSASQTRSTWDSVISGKSGR